MIKFLQRFFPQKKMSSIKPIGNKIWWCFELSNTQKGISRECDNHLSRKVQHKFQLGQPKLIRELRVTIKENTRRIVNERLQKN